MNSHGEHSHALNLWQFLARIAGLGEVTEVNSLLGDATLAKEKLYRLYSDKIATNGNKIPYLNKAKVFKMQKNIARTKSVSCLIMADGNTEIICNFKEDGSINIEFSYFKIPVSVAKIDEYIKTYVNPIIEVIKNFLEQSGYTFILYNNINRDKIKVTEFANIIGKSDIVIP